MILGEPIILGGGGGIACVVIITTDPSAVVTCSLGNTSISKTANADGKAVFELKKAGVWTITASLNGETVSKEIDTSLALETEIQFSKPLAECTWEEISAVSKSGKASQYWNVGDTKKFTFNNAVYEAQIIGFDHDDVADEANYGREKAGITFQIKELVGSGIRFNTSSTNASWPNSNARAVLQSYIDEKTIDESLMNIMVQVNKLYEDSATDRTAIKSSADMLFLLSESELIGAVDLSLANTGEQYAFYAAGNSKIKYKVGTTTKGEYWTRSRKYNYSNLFVYVNTSGTLARSTTSTSCLLAPAFCV